MEGTESKTAFMFERVSPQEDLTDRTQQFTELTDKIAAIDDALEKKIQKIVVEDDSKGKVINAIVEEAKEQKTKSIALLETVEEEIEKLVSSYNEQVDAIKSQSMMITYREMMYSTSPFGNVPKGPPYK
ncbi:MULTISPECIES: hypothetical protein [Bacillaceae]|jgi:uncharacterized protein YsxB (DUF464 family)|uniref:Uncharacterized protein n=1 Tax=Priestia veravalensis TaxID=1414648 RepID=A0A0V8JHX7_9BACI|nr:MULTISPECIES: hypothetical protein [Bacillaceae]USY53364.1 hypothetical protein NIZ91_11400 [Bacillus sp. 1780r2a1]KSU86660.1 hypothetical protein AS180_17335 [Priestia veravalensis]MDT2046631.1 hypothetical protein [Priestia flexa]TDB49704.1 hypothetical protein EPL02_11440 [Bacillus sp. CBEL-1]WEZ06949.1 hypothetical protein P5663_12680 [Priestia flexa]